VKFAIVGAGAIGGFLGAHLARAGFDVTLIARGAHLAAMQSAGIRVVGDGDDFVAHPRCTDDIAAISDASVVFLTMKAHALPPIASSIGAALSSDAAVVTAQNGLPWWFFERYEGPLAGAHLRSVDPDGAIAANIDVSQVVGCVVYPATRIAAPGLIEHIEGTRFSIGEPDGSKSERCQAISAALVKAGLKAPLRTRIRNELWLKLIGNVAFNPLSALTRATLVDIATFPETRATARAVMEEVDSVGRALGMEMDLSVDQRLAGAEKVGAHKTSMLQDLESGRPLEIDAMVGAVVEVGDLLGLELPRLQTLYACTRLLDRTVRNQR